MTASANLYRCREIGDLLRFKGCANSSPLNFVHECHACKAYKTANHRLLLPKLLIVSISFFQVDNAWPKKPFDLSHTSIVIGLRPPIRLFGYPLPIAQRSEPLGYPNPDALFVVMYMLVAATGCRNDTHTDRSLGSCSSSLLAWTPTSMDDGGRWAWLLHIGLEALRLRCTACWLFSESEMQGAWRLRTSSALA
ncbi:uncharacterized protein LACBIDRAFT_335008 [Laccaria bicolor S238N-H82]|uniref:Predicted protein n=1 Tax=Laccaria bicolor (strain S238N-H82 / ATCC MYA-4686) TaxID=486041 RepID=B0E126_LACBS|nr:uncharacterized protein LACBIDRAFT_335008 [Laccaria bicolor S238N-H82]EDQ99438.1 predicted protein [Laccaria bicolor S238N-H82]|eukprot:XP_001889893.1 predicted protein [Laccaria bicolor S238N-H82]